MRVDQEVVPVFRLFDWPGKMHSIGAVIPTHMLGEGNSNKWPDLKYRINKGIRQDTAVMSDRVRFLTDEDRQEYLIWIPLNRMLCDKRVVNDLCRELRHLIGRYDIHNTRISGIKPERLLEIVTS